MRLLPEPIQFDWDEGNRRKSWMKHKVADEECEEVFFDPHKRILKETLHSGRELRHVLLGRTSLERALFIVFTAEDAPGLPGVSGAVPARGDRPRAGGRAKRGPLTLRGKKIRIISARDLNRKERMLL